MQIFRRSCTGNTQERDAGDPGRSVQSLWPLTKWLTQGIYEHSGDYEAGAYESKKKQPLSQLFQFHDDSDGAWPYNRTYDGWGDMTPLPKLNYENSENWWSIY